MSRRYDHSRDELYKMALDASRSIAAKDGIRALTVRKVATAMGYSIGTIYNLFKNLDDLIVHINASTLDALYDALGEGDKSEQPEQAVHQMTALYINFTQQNFNLWNALFEHRLPEDQPLPDWYGGKVARLLLLVERTIEPLFENQDVQNCQKSARVLWSSLHGICSLAASEKLDIVGHQTATELADNLVTHYLAGLKAKQN
jgi:AcrR family transcriptional regulator